MEGFRFELFSRHELQAARLIAGCTALLLGAGTVYLGAGIGRTSNSPLPGSPAAIGSWSFVSATSGWVALTEPGTDRARVFSSSDGGKGWRLAGRLPAGVPDDLRFFDQVRGIATLHHHGQPARLYRTSDAGASWLPLPLPAPAGGLTSFVTPDAGWYLELPPGAIGFSGDLSTEPVALFRTLDGGVNWTELFRVDADRPLAGGLNDVTTKEELFFIDRFHGTLISRQGAQVGAYVTADAGASWRWMVMAAPEGGWPPFAQFLIGPVVASGPDDEAFTVVAAPTTPGGVSVPRSVSPLRLGTYAYVSHDQGQTWIGPTLIPTGGLAPNSLPIPIALVPSGGLAAFEGSRVWTSPDYGGLWVSVASRVPHPASIDAVTFFSSLHAVGVAFQPGSRTAGIPPQRVLLKTSNGGVSWTALDLPVAG